MAAMNPRLVLTVVEDGGSRTTHSDATQSSHTCMQHSCSSCGSDSPGAQIRNLAAIVAMYSFQGLARQEASGA